MFTAAEILDVSVHGVVVQTNKYSFSLSKRGNFTNTERCATNFRPSIISICEYDVPDLPDHGTTSVPRYILF